MKKLLFSMAAAALLLNVTSCQNEDVVLQQQEETTAQEFTLQATYGTATRTTLEEAEAASGGYTTLWSAGDQIYVSDESGKVTGVLTLTEGEGKNNGVFKGVVTGDPATLKYAIFPVPENGIIDLSKVDAGQVDAPMTANINGSQANFQNACGLVRLNIYNPGNAVIKLSATGISGTLRVEGGKLVSGTPSDEITIENVQSGQPFFVPVVAGETTSQKLFTLTVDSKTATFEANTKAGAVSQNGISDLYVTDNGPVNVKELTPEQKEKENLATTQEELNSRITNSDETTPVNLLPGKYTLPSGAAGKTLTIVGSEGTKISVTSGLTYARAADITFEGITIQSEPEGEGYNNGFADLKYATFNNCVIEGTLGLDFSCEFNGCTFNIEGNYYNVWTWGAGTASFTKCTFNCDGKALLVYANVLDNGTNHQTVNIDGCTFNDNGDNTVTGKAAIEITNTYTPIRTYDVFINKTTVNGFAQTVPSAGDFNAAYGSVKGSNIGTNVWGNKCQLPNTQINVVIDGVDVY